MPLSGRLSPGRHSNLLAYIEARIFSSVRSTCSTLRPESQVEPSRRVVLSSSSTRPLTAIRCTQSVSVFPRIDHGTPSSARVFTAPLPFLPPSPARSAASSPSPRTQSPSWTCQAWTWDLQTRPVPLRLRLPARFVRLPRRLIPSATSDLRIHRPPLTICRSRSRCCGTGIL